MRYALIVLTLVVASSATALGADTAAGKADYNRSCKACHGADGKANSAISKAMNVEIPDLKSAAVQSMSEEDLKKVITDGKGKMQPVRSLSGKQVDDIVVFLRTLK